MAPDNINNSSNTTNKKKSSNAVKESPVPPPRELILASPDLILNSKSRLSLDTFHTYFECLGPKQMLVDNKRTR